MQSVQSCVTNTSECSSVIKLQGCRLCVTLSREIGSVGDAENVLMFSAWSVSLTLLELQLIEHRLENSSAWFLNHSAFLDVKSQDFTRLCPVCIYHLFLLIMSDWRSVGKFLKPLSWYQISLAPKFVNAITREQGNIGTSNWYHRCAP